MFVDLGKFFKPNSVVAVALSGGSDSMALLYYMHANAKKYSLTIKALNVEHGIRGEESKSDTAFVKDYCKKLGIPLIEYSVNCLAFCKENKLSLEEGARILRYQCFNDAISNGKCDVVATAHHALDNCESVLFNLFRGTGLSGLGGIVTDFESKIVRPFLSVTKQEIEDYVKENSIPYVVDQTNYDTTYTRNFIRQEIMPKIKSVFKDAEKSVLRLSTIAKEESEYLDSLANSYLNYDGENWSVSLPIDDVLFKRAIILAFKNSGIEKDWEKAHVDACLNLVKGENADMVSLPKQFLAIREYDKIVVYKSEGQSFLQIPFGIGEFKVKSQTVKVEKAEVNVDLKSGFFADLDKIPNGSVIRFKRDGDLFTKFGGGTKKLNDYLTDIKIPFRLRDSLPLLCNGNKVLAIFGIAISSDVKVDENTKRIVKLY